MEPILKSIKNNNNVQNMDMYKVFLNKWVRVVKRETNQLFTIKGIFKECNEKGVLIKIDDSETRFIAHQSINEIVKLGDRK